MLERQRPCPPGLAVVKCSQKVSTCYKPRGASVRAGGDRHDLEPGPVRLPVVSPSGSWCGVGATDSDGPWGLAGSEGRLAAVEPTQDAGQAPGPA